MSSSNNVFPKFLTLKQRQNIKITKPKKGKKITKDEYSELAINAMKKYKKIRS